MNFHNFTLEVFFVSLCRKCSWGNPSVFPKIGVLKNFMHNMGLHKLLTKFFPLTLPKNFVGNPFVSQKNPGSKKTLDKRGGGESWDITFFRLSFFVSLCRKSSWGNPSVFPKIGILKNFMHNQGLHKFLTNFFPLTLPKNFVGNPFVSQKIPGLKEKLWIKRGEGWGITFLRLGFFVSRCRKTSCGNHLFQKISGAKKNKYG